MANRTINGVKIRLLIKTFSDWETIKNTFKPLRGEACIVLVPASSGAVAQEPAVLVKIGDGDHYFADLPYSSALAADVYNWAKKANLDWNDLDATFISELENKIHTEAPQYRLASAGKDKWKLQKSTDDGTTWIDVVDAEDKVPTIDFSGKVDRKIETVTADGTDTALIFNEYDGGGAKFEHHDGTHSFIGVNNGGQDGLDAQIYAIDKKAALVSGKAPGTRINVYRDKIFYISQANQADGRVDRGVNDDMEIVVKRDIQNLAGAMHFKGVISNKTAQQTYEQAIAAHYTSLGETPTAGDVVLFTDGKEFVCSAEGTTEPQADPVWEEIGDQNTYATRMALEQEILDRQAADATKIDESDFLILNCNYEDESNNNGGE